jgi:hypothetical protein
MMTVFDRLGQKRRATILTRDTVFTSGTVYADPYLGIDVSTHRTHTQLRRVKLACPRNQFNDGEHTTIYASAPKAATPSDCGLLYHRNHLANRQIGVH